MLPCSKTQPGSARRPISGDACSAQISEPRARSRRDSLFKAVSVPRTGHCFGQRCQRPSAGVPSSDGASQRLAQVRSEQQENLSDSRRSCSGQIRRWKVRRGRQPNVLPLCAATSLFVDQCLALRQRRRSALDRRIQTRRAPSSFMAFLLAQNQCRFWCDVLRTRSQPA
jgi:hypothetical protein